MKNLFNWSVVVSALTIYFYWYGYWYTEGYIRYFGHDIKAYDIPLQHIIVAGALQSLEFVFVLIIALILVSLLLQFSKNQYFKFFKRMEIALLYVWFNIVGLLGVLFNLLSEIFYKFLRSDRIIRVINKINIYNKKYEKFLANITIYLKYIAKRVVQHAKKIVDFNKKISYKKIVEVEEISIELIDNKIKKEDATTFDIQYLLHVLIMFTIVPFLLVSLDYSSKINGDGFNDAEKLFNCSITNDKEGCENYYSRINITETDLQESIEDSNTIFKESNQKWYLTDICLHRRCLVFNKYKVAKFVDITDKEILMKGN
jgi:hypothetical protein